ncbi:hypothetical protein AB4455_20285 [Vibrio sp. 10N.261.46.E12]|uniref:hypothetical protein n=1 Tax=unclassified Vibrio TaxID=2614977 RepID=UPI0013F60D1F|nr:MULTISPECIES: hypothetical protein [unclassified Vibrio]
MKHFLPSSVMLTPFLVKYYDEEPQASSDEYKEEESPAINSENKQKELANE